MKEYSVQIANGQFNAEDTMNAMSRDGWRVFSVNYDCECDVFAITFEKDE